VSISNLLVFGRTGQLALSLAERAPRHDLEPLFLGRSDVDLLDVEGLKMAIKESGARTIINAAAYTSVDQAETEPEIAHRVNALAPGAMARASALVGARLIHVSSDYVFNGESTEPYREDAPLDPTSVYGRTKAEGEDAVRHHLPEHAIVRTAWVYSPFGRNFVKTMLGLASSRPELRVVGDQIGNPTSALDLADGLLSIAAAWREQPNLGLGTTYHFAGHRAVSWAEFARCIFEISAELGGPTAEVLEILSSDYPTPARRPANSRLDSSLFQRTFKVQGLPWPQPLFEAVERVLRETAAGG
jgi:dTDP-4-dehydrorhamnose reductase